MKLTVKGQVTIPKHVRDRLGIKAHSEIEFIEENDRVYIVRKKSRKINQKFRKYRGVAKIKMTTEEIMKLTRE
jgi:AbrB family looped-hinge helix DNA binding protein